MWVACIVCYNRYCQFLNLLGKKVLRKFDTVGNPCVIFLLLARLTVGSLKLFEIPDIRGRQ
jgi:hypothetical protein